MTLDNHFMRVLGKYLRELAPLIKAAVQVLDQKGSRALRYKLDRDFHAAMGAYNAMWRSSLPYSDDPMGDQVEYGRVIPSDRADKRPKAESRRGGHLVLVGGTDLQAAELEEVDGEAGAA